MTEQSGPRALVRHAPLAEDAGFDFAVMSDHYSPWLDAQAHSPYAWSVLAPIVAGQSFLLAMSWVRIEKPTSSTALSWSATANGSACRRRDRPGVDRS